MPTAAHPHIRSHDGRPTNPHNHLLCSLTTLPNPIVQVRKGNLTSACLPFQRRKLVVLLSKLVCFARPSFYCCLPPNSKRSLYLLLPAWLPIQSGQLATLPIKQAAAGKERQGQGGTITRACSPTTTSPPASFESSCSAADFRRPPHVLSTASPGP